MLKAYIIKSRVRKAENLMIVQPYNPHLFRQGLLPGPSLLLDVLLKKKTALEAKSAWKAKEEAKELMPAAGKDNWLLSMTLPCRRCTDNDASGCEVWLPVRHFTVESKPKPQAVYALLSQGQDLTCTRCQEQLGWKEPGSIVCNKCEKRKLDDAFNDVNRTRWLNEIASHISCNSCLGIQQNKRDVFVWCNGYCLKELPEYWFEDAKLVEWKTTNTISILARCSRCVLRDDETYRDRTFICSVCNDEKFVQELAPHAAKSLLQKTSNQGTKNRQTCVECMFPPCAKCTERPLYALPHNARIEGVYWCHECKYPPCQVILDDGVTTCSNTRLNPGGNNRFKAYTCPSCEAQKPNACSKHGDEVVKYLGSSCPRCARSGFPIATPVETEVFQISAGSCSAVINDSVTTPSACMQKADSPCRWCHDEVREHFSLDLIHYTTLCICESCRKFPCAFCGKVFPIVVDDRFRRGMQKRPDVMTCGAPRCEQKSVKSMQTCANKACGFQKNPYVLDQNGLTCFAPRQSNRGKFLKLCRKCMK